MPRRPRQAIAGLAYHVLNRAAGRATLFHKDVDYAAFERVLEEAGRRMKSRLVCYCVMPNHWHLVLWPRSDGELSEFMRWLTVTHTQRCHAHRHTAGSGPLYQGRFKSFPIQQDQHFLTVCRYVERNALRAGLVRRAEDWHWSSLWRRRSGSAQKWEFLLRANEWPVTPPVNWTALVDRGERGPELERLRVCVQRSRPYGEPAWQERTAVRLGAEASLRPRGRPRKTDGDESDL
jgi:putative transposase